jgi:hypothetical protein
MNTLPKVWVSDDSDRIGNCLHVIAIGLDAVALRLMQLLSPTATGQQMHAKRRGEFLRCCILCRIISRRLLIGRPNASVCANASSVHLHPSPPQPCVPHLNLYVSNIISLSYHLGFRLILTTMADPLTALGGVAAVAQLIHYGTKLLLVTFSLPRHIRQAPSRIELWIGKSDTMVLLLDDLSGHLRHLNRESTHLLRQCRQDIVRLQILLRPFVNIHRSRRSTKFTELSFIVRRQTEIEELIKSLNETFALLALMYVIVSRSTTLLSS